MTKAKSSAAISSEGFERINAYRTRVYKGADYLEGINSFLEKRKPNIKGERAKNIVNFLKLQTLTDIVNLTYEDLLTVPGIGPVLAQKIMDAIK